MQALHGGGRRLAAALLRRSSSSSSNPFLTANPYATASVALPRQPGQLPSAADFDNELDVIRAVEDSNRSDKAFVDSWDRRLRETKEVMRQVRNPGVRASPLTEDEKDAMWKLHKEDAETFTVERLSRDFRVVRQKVHCVLWWKELEESGKLGPEGLESAVQVLLDSYPQYFCGDDKEFHVANLPHKPDFKVMREDWDGTTRDPDEVLYEISMKEDQMMYEEFLLRFEYNKRKMAGEVLCHKYARRRPSDGWKITIEKLGSEGKRGFGGGWKFVSLPDGSSRPLNELERMFLKRETPRRRRRMKPF